MYKNSVKKIINFSAENLHLYHYAGNNPIKYVDPDGKWTLFITFNGTAAAGAEGTGGIGIILGFSQKKEFSFGFVETHSIGAQEGASLNVSVTVGFSPSANEVMSGKSESLTVGGSGEIPVGVGIGGDVSVDMKSGETSYSASLSFGVGTPVEAHQLYTTTNTISIEDLSQKIIDNITPLEIIRTSNQENNKD